MKSAAAEEEGITAARIEEHSKILRERDVLTEQLKQLQEDLKLAHSTISEQVNLQTLIVSRIVTVPCINFISSALKHRAHGALHVP